MAKKKNWFWRNKEGAIIGGILGGIITHFWYIPTTPCASVPIACFWFLGVGVILGVVVGAFIDSKWKPNK